MDEVKKANASVECPHRLAKHASTRRSRYSDSSDDRKHKAKRRKEKHKSHKKKSKRKESKVKRHKKIEAVDYIELPLQLQGQGGSESLKEDSNVRTARSFAPMSKEEFDKKQSQVRRVYDPDTGRHRLVKGGGEIIEEIVSRDRHKQINKQATRGDELSFQSGLSKIII